MRILFDQGTPLPLRDFLKEHQVSTAFRMGWSTLGNGDLIRAAETQFDAIITTDKNWKYQQQVAGRKISIIVLPTTDWQKVQLIAPQVADAVNRLLPGEYIEV